MPCRAFRKPQLVKMTDPSPDDLYAQIRSLDTGDVLLYRTRDLGATFNAVMQGSLYSHVSMVVCGDPDKLREMYPKDYKDCGKSDLAILEVVPVRGVALFPLEARLARTIDNIQYLSVRRHSGIITDKSRANLDVFMKEVLGRKLEMATTDMARSLFFNRLRGKLGGDNKEEHWDKFFCSELVAEALQQLFIVREEGLCSNNLIPSSFAEPRNPTKHKGRSFDFTERVTLPGHSYGSEEILVVPNGPLYNALKERKRQMKEEYKRKKQEQGEVKHTQHISIFNFGK